MEYSEGGDNSRISNLPNSILHHILYFLSKREAAQTCVLSKSWRHVWSTRPKLRLLQTSFRRRDGNCKTAFVSHVCNNLQAHLDRNIRVEELSLVISRINSQSIALLEKWIPLLPAIGVRELSLSIMLKRGKLSYDDLPTVVLKAESLKLLCIYRCKLGQNALPHDDIPLKRLEFFRLKDVFIKKSIFDKIMSSCPMIKTVWFQECEGLKTIMLVNKDHHKYLKHFTFTNDKIYKKENCRVEMKDLENLKTIKISGSKIRFHGHNFGNLKSLSLNRVGISIDSFDNSSCNFPSLVYMRLAGCYGFEQIHLHIDAPNIRGFGYIGDFIPSISFAPTSKDWRSYIELFAVDLDDAAPSWFLKLSKLLQALSSSEICLNIFQNPRSILNIQEYILVLDNELVQVNHLVLNGHLSSFPFFVNGLFCICRPRDVIHHWYTQGHSEFEREQKELTEFLCKIIIKRGSGNQEIRQDLEHVKIESFDTSRQEWQSIMGSIC